VFDGADGLVCRQWRYSGSRFSEVFVLEGELWGRDLLSFHVRTGEQWMTFNAVLYGQSCRDIMEPCRSPYELGCLHSMELVSMRGHVIQTSSGPIFLSKEACMTAEPTQSLLDLGECTAVSDRAAQMLREERGTD